MYRNRLIMLTVALSLALSGCASSNSGSEQRPQPITQSAPHFLVWWSVEEGGFATALVRQDADQSRVVAEAEGLFIATESGIWTWEETPLEITQVDCACAMERGLSDPAAIESCEVSREVSRTELVQLDGEGRFIVSAEPEELEGEYEAQAHPTASSSGIVTVTECSYIYACGAAHGSTNCQFSAFDLDRGRALEAADLVEPLSVADQIALLNSQSDEPVEEETLVGLVEAEPSWSETGEVSFVATYAAATCYACSDGEWSSYTFTASHAGATPIVELEPAPEAVVQTWALAAGTSPTSARGWSRVNPDDVPRLQDALR